MSQDPAEATARSVEELPVEALLALVTVGFAAIMPEAVDASCAYVERVVAETSRLRVPTLAILGEVDVCDPTSESAGDAAWFDGAYNRVVLPGVGHFPGREAATMVADTVLAFQDRVVGTNRDASRRSNDTR